MAETGKTKDFKMADSKAKKGFNPLRFFKEVKMEGKKITWATRQETTVSTLAVFMMVFIASIFLYFADQLLALVVRFIMGY
ncbi:MAG: preprotein translocase subunit SecE [Bdellovibrionales bacterium]